MFSGGGILGVGPSEVFVIVTVGWLLLGPDKMVKLSKDAGKLLGRVRRTADEAKDSLKDAIDLDMISEEANAIKTEFEAAAAGITEPRKRKGETKESAKDSGNGSVKDSAKGLADDVAEAMPGIADMEESDLTKEMRAPTKEMGAPMTAETQMPVPSGEVKPGLDAGGSSAFLDQLRRVADPNQVAPAEIQDLGTDVEENEVERLEREYLEAKEKLENRRRERAKVDGRDDINHGAGER